MTTNANDELQRLIDDTDKTKRELESATNIYELEQALKASGNACGALAAFCITNRERLTLAPVATPPAPEPTAKQRAPFPAEQMNSLTKMQQALLKVLHDGRYIYRRNNEHASLWFDIEDKGGMFSDSAIVRPLIEKGYLYEERINNPDGQWEWHAALGDGPKPGPALDDIQRQAVEHLTEATRTGMPYFAPVVKLPRRDKPSIVDPVVDKFDKLLTEHAAPEPTPAPAVKLTAAQVKALKFLAERGDKGAYRSNRTGYGKYDSFVSERAAETLIELGYAKQSRAPGSDVVVTDAGIAALKAVK